VKVALRLLIAVAIVALVSAAIAGANFAAGGVLFLLHKQDPRDATFWTIKQAWQSKPQGSTRRKVVISMAVGAGLCIILPFGLVMAATSTRRPLHGTARFGHFGDVKKAGLYALRGILLGKFAGKFLRLPGFEFVMLAAPTRSKKGAAFVVPNLLTFPHSAVVQDIKGENHVLTGEFRRQHLGQAIYYFNPFSETSHRSNPLSYISADPNHRISDLQALAANLYVEQPNETPIWIGSARDLFLGLTLMVLESPELPHTLGEVLRQATGKGMPLQDYVASVIRQREERGDPLSRVCKDALRRGLGHSENTLKGVITTLLAPLNFWSNPLVDKATSADDFDVRDLRKKLMTIYVCVPVRQIVGANVLMNLFFSQLIGENLREQPQDNPELKYQALLMMDEFTSMGRVSIIEKGVSYMASYNLRLAIVIQDTAQLVDVYGREAAHNISTNMGARIYFAPGDLDDAKMLSETVGYLTETGRSKQYSNNASASGGSTGRSVTVTEQRRALMLPQEARELDATKQLIVRTGVPVIKADKAVYYMDPELKKLFDSVPASPKVVDGETRSVPHAPALPPAHWDEYKASLERSDAYVLADQATTQAACDLAGASGEARLLQVINGLPDGELPTDEVAEAMDELVALKTREYLAQLEEEPADA